MLGVRLPLLCFVKQGHQDSLHELVRSDDGIPSEEQHTSIPLTGSYRRPVTRLGFHRLQRVRISSDDGVEDGLCLSDEERCCRSGDELLEADEEARPSVPSRREVFFGSQGAQITLSVVSSCQLVDDDAFEEATTVSPSSTASASTFAFAPSPLAPRSGREHALGDLVLESQRGHDCEQAHGGATPLSQVSKGFDTFMAQDDLFRVAEETLASGSTMSPMLSGDSGHNDFETLTENNDYETMTETQSEAAPEDQPKASRRVSFKTWQEDSGATEDGDDEEEAIYHSEHSVEAYQDIYGDHPRNFEFGQDGQMIPASEAATSALSFLGYPIFFSAEQVMQRDESSPKLSCHL